MDCSFSMVLLIYCKVQFFLSTTPFDSGVRGAKKFTGRLLGTYNLGVATPRALVYAGDKTSGDARLLDDLRVTAAKVYVTAAKHKLLMLLVQKLLLLVLKVNAAGMKVTIAERLQLLEEFMLTEKRPKTYQRKYKDFLKIKIT
ncbi:hypothetical protein Tco_0637334 [Tanacetum coccineum]